MKRIIFGIALLCGAIGCGETDQNFTLVNGKILLNPTILQKTNKLVRILHDGGDSTYQMNLFTKPAQKIIDNTPINHAKRKELEAIVAAEEAKRKARHEIKNEPNREPPFPVSLSDIKYLGGGSCLPYKE